MSEEMYTEVILDYYRHPKNFGTIENPDIKAKDTNPLCGDVIEMNRFRVLKPLVLTTRIST